MSTGLQFQQSEEEPFRETTKKDLESDASPTQIAESEFDVDDFRTDLAERLREMIRRRSLADKIKEEYAGQGVVAVNRTSGEVLAVADNMRELSLQLFDMDYDPEDTIMVRCYGD